MRAQLAEAQKIANGSGSEQDIAEAKIEVEVRIKIPIAIYTLIVFRFWTVCKHH